MLVSNQRPLPCEVCEAYSTASYYIQVFRIFMPISSFTGSMSSYRLLVFSAPVTARLQQASLSTFYDVARSSGAQLLGHPIKEVHFRFASARTPSFCEAFGS